MYVCSMLCMFCKYICAYASVYRLEIVSSEATPLAVLGEDEETAVLKMDQNSPPVNSDSHATKGMIRTHL